MADLPLSLQSLSFAGATLEDGHGLSERGIQDGATLDLIMLERQVPMKI